MAEGVKVQPAEIDMILRVKELSSGVVEVIIRTEKVHQGGEEYRNLASYWEERLVKRASEERE